MVFEFEGYNGSYLPPRHMPKNLVDQNSLEHGTSKLFPMLIHITVGYTDNNQISVKFRKTFLHFMTCRNYAASIIIIAVTRLVYFEVSTKILWGIFG